MKEAYYGHESQLFGVEEHRLVGGRGDGMRLLQVKNGLGLEFTVSADRCCDIARLSFRGDNFGFFSVNGYAAPAYYDDKGMGWLKNFTAGFLTTCGLFNVGSPCTADGEALGIHGSIANTPAEQLRWEMDDERIAVTGVMNSARIFSHKLSLTRTIVCSKRTNEITLTDEIRNFGGLEAPLMVLYHMNMGYPLLQESSELFIPSDTVTPRDERAAEGLDAWNRIGSPEPGFAEQCYFHEFLHRGRAGIFSPVLDKGLLIEFDPSALDYFTQWKLMDVKDYVMGLEPSNCSVLGREAMERSGRLKHIAPGETRTYSVRLTVAENRTAWEALKR